MYQDETWQKNGRQVGLGSPHIVLDTGTQLPLPQTGKVPQISAHIYSGQMAGWIKMPLSIELGLGPGDFVLDGDPAPPSKRGRNPPANLSDVALRQVMELVT